VARRLQQEQQRQAGAAQPAAPVESMVQTKQRIEANAYTARVVAEPESMMTGGNRIFVRHEA
jgi:hypothetical protein